jgi:chromosome condensin MukBEF complex kleisin-like MukF subunit
MDKKQELKEKAIFKHVIYPYLKEHPEELEKLVKRFLELRPLAEEFVKCFYILDQAVKNGYQLKDIELSSVKPLIEQLEKLD